MTDNVVDMFGGAVVTVDEVITSLTDKKENIKNVMVVYETEDGTLGFRFNNMEGKDFVYLTSFIANETSTYFDFAFEEA